MKLTIPDPIAYSIWIDLNLCELRKDARLHPDDEIDQLGESMEIKQLVPIMVCRIADASVAGGYRYEVIAGVGRVLAVRKKGWKQIRADVYEGLTEFQKLDMVFSENEDRNNASPLYQAQVIKGMMEVENLNQDQLAEAMGKSQQGISQYVSLQNLSPKIWENTNALVKLGLRHFMQLLRIENKDDQWKLAQIASDKGLSSTELKVWVDKELGVKSGGKKEGRPKGDKTLGPDGYVFKRKKGTILIKGAFEEDKGIAVFLAKVGEGWTQWSQKNPKTTRPAKKPKVGAHAPAQTLQNQTA